LQDQFDLQGEPVKINKFLNASVGRRLGDFKTKLHIIVKEKEKDYARSHPPSNCTLGVIDGNRSNEDWLVIVKP
jgi:hypothetical protein